MKSLPLFTFAILLSSTATALGQFYYPVQPKAATAGESYARGFADVLRSAGAANLMNSAAAKNYEDARSKYMDNRLKGTNYYFEMRALNRQFRDQESGPRPTSDQLFRYAQERAPKRLSPSELDPVSGKIDWPKILRDEKYAAFMQQLEQLFKERAANQGYVTAKQYADIQAAGESIQKLLKENLKDYPPMDYIRAKTFLDSLMHESRRTG